MDNIVRPELLEKIARRQEERSASFEALKITHKLDDTEIAITKLSVLELLRKLEARDLSSSEVLRAFTAKALEVTEKFNCVTEFIPAAAKWAAELDDKAKNKEVPLGPLHGLPIAIKDDLDVEGMDSTLGYAHNLYHPAKTSAVLIQVLRRQGAVPFCKTNLPQSILSFGSDNPIYGWVKNALRSELAPGGSSSGSACIVAGGGAPLATGCDLGGSLCCPSHYHGLSTLKGTTNRLSEKGMTEAVPIITQRGVPGIIAPTAETLAFVWKCLLEGTLQNQLDPMAVPLPWNENLFSSCAKLRLGYFTSLPFLPATPDTQKTVISARDALRREGHSVVSFQLPDDYAYMENICCKMLGHTETAWLKKKFEGEPLATCTREFITALRSPHVFGAMNTENMSRRAKILFSQMGQNDGAIPSGVYHKRPLVRDILERMERAGVDLLLGPAFPHPAVKLEYGHRTMASVVYAVIWNIIDFPAGSVRFGTESASSIDSYDDEGDPVLKELKEVTVVSFNRALRDSAGMPINVQVIGKPYKEEEVLRALVEIEKLRN